MSLLTRKDMAEALGVSVDYFRKKVETRPDFPRPAFRLSRETVRWDAPDFERWMRQQKQLAKA